ncbi:protein AAR2 homolog [Watersipora subatra]|uniref:protein AAR2 homolog n=1 Tax=Watersipora subatra TaxID=2589382 RepID=UPI00355C38BD
MDQATANHLFEAGAVLVLLDVPKGTEIGIDMHSWQVTANFKGIKMIPPGLHFIYFTVPPSGDGCQNSPRSGFFRAFSEREVVVRKWNTSLELFENEVVDEELQKFKDNKKELDRYCGPYPYDSYKKWISLSQHITAHTVQRTQPKSGFVLSVSALLSMPSNSSSRAAKSKAEPIPMEKLNADNLMPDMQLDPNEQMNYTPVHRFLEGSDPKTITDCAVNSQLVLEDFISRCHSCQNVLGELQMAFICFLIGQQYDSFEQWKKVVGLLCNNQCIEKYSSMYSDLISVLHFQMKEIPEDFFVDIVSSDNFLTHTLHSLFTNMQNSDASSDLKTRAAKFSKNLTKQFGWCFEEEPDDCAPVIVDEQGNY